jgi:hypothetical protein
MTLAALFGQAVGLDLIFLIAGLFVLAPGLLRFWLLQIPEQQRAREKPNLKQKPPEANANFSANLLLVVSLVSGYCSIQ